MGIALLQSHPSPAGAAEVNVVHSEGEVLPHLSVLLLLRWFLLLLLLRQTCLPTLILPRVLLCESRTCSRLHPSCLVRTPAYDSELEARCFRYLLPPLPVLLRSRHLRDLTFRSDLLLRSSRARLPLQIYAFPIPKRLAIPLSRLGPRKLLGLAPAGTALPMLSLPLPTLLLQPSPSLLPLVPNSLLLLLSPLSAPKRCQRT